MQHRNSIALESISDKVRLGTEIHVEPVDKSPNSKSSLVLEGVVSPLRMNTGLINILNEIIPQTLHLTKHEE